MPRAAEDESELFGRQVTSDLRLLEPRQRLVARQRIANVLLELLLSSSEPDALTTTPATSGGGIDVDENGETTGDEATDTTNAPSNH